MSRWSHSTILSAGILMLLESPVCSAQTNDLIRTDFGYVRFAAGDIARATEIGMEVHRTALDVLGIDVRFAMVDRALTKSDWGDTTTLGVPVYPWTFANGVVDLSVQPPDHILAHEMGHDLFRRHLVPSSQPNQYGTDAPDWLDEAVAIAFESADQKAERRCDTYRHLAAGTLISLDRFLDMDHPDLEPSPSAVDGNRKEDFALEISVSPDTPAYYAMSFAFHEYLVDRLGSRSVLGEIARAFVSGAGLEGWIIHRAKFPLPVKNIVQMERDFLSWIRSHQSYHCSMFE